MSGSLPASITFNPLNYNFAHLRKAGAAAVAAAGAVVVSHVPNNIGDFVLVGSAFVVTFVTVFLTPNQSVDAPVATLTKEGILSELVKVYDTVATEVAKDVSTPKNVSLSIEDATPDGDVTVTQPEPTNPTPEELAALPTVDPTDQND